MDFEFWNLHHFQAGVGTFALSMFSYLIFKPKKKIEEKPQQISHKLKIAEIDKKMSQDIDLFRENQRLAQIIMKLEKERDYFKREAKRWAPFPIDDDVEWTGINMTEAMDWEGR